MNQAPSIKSQQSQHWTSSLPHPVVSPFCLPLLPKKKSRVKKSKSKAVTAREGPGSSLRQVAKCWAAIAAVKSQENKDVKSLRGELGGRKSRSISRCLCQVEKGSVS